MPQILITGRRWLSDADDHDPVVMDLKREISASLADRSVPRVLVVTHPDGLQQAELLAHSDVVIYVENDENALTDAQRESVRSLASMTASSFEDAMDQSSQLLWLLAQHRRNQRARMHEEYDPATRPTTSIRDMLRDGTWEMSAAIADIVDDGFFVEFEPEQHDLTMGPSLMMGLALINGHLVGVLGDTDAADFRGTDKYRRFVEFCNRHRIFIQAIPDAGGFRCGTGQEKGRIQQRGAKSLDANINGQQGVGVLVKQAYGGHAIHRWMNTIRPGIRTLAFADAPMAVMGKGSAFDLFIGFKFIALLEQGQLDNAEQKLDRFVKKYGVELTEGDLAEIERNSAGKGRADALQVRHDQIRRRFEISFTEKSAAKNDASANGLVDTLVYNPLTVRTRVIENMYEARDAAASAFRNRSDVITPKESDQIAAVKALEALGVRVRPHIADAYPSPRAFNVLIENINIPFQPADLLVLARYARGSKEKFLADLGDFFQQAASDRQQWLRQYGAIENLATVHQDLAATLTAGSQQVYGAEADDIDVEAVTAQVAGLLQLLRADTAVSAPTTTSSVTADDGLDVGLLRDNLSQGDIAIAVQHTQETASTNTLARQAAAEGAPWELFITDYQNNGRGQQQRQWNSPRGNIAMTLLRRDLDPSVRDDARVTAVVGIAVARALSSYLPGVKLKWPNDLYLDGLKLGGILVEEGEGASLAIGIGINANSTLFDFDPAVRGLLVTMSDKLGREVSREELMARISQEVVGALQAFENGEWDALLQEYRDRSYLIGRTVEIQDSSDEGTVGVVQGINEQGFLVVLPSTEAADESTPDAEPKPIVVINEDVRVIKGRGD